MKTGYGWMAHRLECLSPMASAERATPSFSPFMEHAFTSSSALSLLSKRNHKSLDQDRRLRSMTLESLGSELKLLLFGLWREAMANDEIGERLRVWKPQSNGAMQINQGKAPKRPFSIARLLSSSAWCQVASAPQADCSAVSSPRTHKASTLEYSEPLQEISSYHRTRLAKTETEKADFRFSEG